MEFDMPNLRDLYASAEKSEPPVSWVFKNFPGCDGRTLLPAALAKWRFALADAMLEARNGPSPKLADAISTMEAIYYKLCQTPHGSERVRLQPFLCMLRDSIAKATDRSSQQVQDDFSERVIKDRQAGIPDDQTELTQALALAEECKPCIVKIEEVEEMYPGPNNVRLLAHIVAALRCIGITALSGVDLDDKPGVIYFDLFEKRFRVTDRWSVEVRQQVGYSSSAETILMEAALKNYGAAEETKRVFAALVEETDQLVKMIDIGWTTPSFQAVLKTAKEHIQK